MEYKKWVKDCLKAFISYDEGLLKSLLFSAKILLTDKTQEVKRAIEGILTQEFEVNEGEITVWVTFLTEHIDARSRKHQIFRHLNLAFQSFVKIYKEEDEGYRYLGTLKLYALKLIKEGTKISSLKEVLNSLRMLLSACQSNKPLPDSHVVGLYFAINAAFKTSFRLNNLQHVASFLRIVNSEFSKYPNLAKFPKAEQVEFKFHEGRYHIYEYNIEQAEQCLDLAFANCLKSSRKNKKIILKYLIPLKVLSGKFPSQGLLRKYGLEGYSDILESIKKGDVSQYLQYLKANQSLHIQQGMLIIMDSVKLIVYRNLFKKVQKIISGDQISLIKFVKALNVIGVNDTNLLDVEGIFMSLIYNKWVKAVINSPDKIVIFRSKNPFPKIGYA